MPFSQVCPNLVRDLFAQTFACETGLERNAKWVFFWKSCRTSKLENAPASQADLVGFDSLVLYHAGKADWRGNPLTRDLRQVRFLFPAPCPRSPTGRGPCLRSRLLEVQILSWVPREDQSDFRRRSGSMPTGFSPCPFRGRSHADVAQFWQRRLTQTEVVTSSNLVVGTTVRDRSRHGSPIGRRH